MNVAEQVLQLKTDFDEVKQAGYIKGEEVGRKAGYNYGWNDGLQQGLVDGKQAEYDTFWDALQKNGTLDSYNYTFAGTGWNDTTFKPKYDISPTKQGHNMFNSTRIVNLAEILAQAGRCIDLTKVNGGRIDCMFQYSSQIAHVPELDAKYAYYDGGELNQMFNGCTKLHTIDKIILKDDGSTNPGSSTFNNCIALENITFVGVIGSAGWSFKDCPLSKVSITSIINALSTTTSGLTLTLKKTAVQNAFGSTTADEWTALIATKPNWTINLA